MILADTSVWVQHFRKGLPDFGEALQLGHITTHEVVLGELACGNFSQRLRTLTLLDELPRAASVTYAEARHFIEEHRLHGKGLGWNDVLILAAARLRGIPVWTLDRPLHAAAQKLKLAHA